MLNPQLFLVQYKYECPTIRYICCNQMYTETTYGGQSKRYMVFGFSNLSFCLSARDIYVHWEFIVKMN